ncbi:MAG: hypothetical protein Ta2A_11640 [Treponemataceae bacterium]|nr:MAG: hypothetical protein Ta2A_11640 [Treponemataceae bacterium]
MKKYFAFFGTLVFALAFSIVFSGCKPLDMPTLSYTLTYYGNGSDGGTVPTDTSKYIVGTQATALDNIGNLTNGSKEFFSWNTKPDGTGTWYPAGARITMSSHVKLYASWQDPLVAGERNFWAMKVTDNTWYTVKAKIIGESAHSIVYADVTQTGITESNGAEIAAKYESAIYTQITGAFGDIYDVDKNGKVIFLLLDIIDGYTGSGGYVAGYFQGYQMYSKAAAPYSNAADMLYMDTNPGFNPVNANAMQSFYSTMAHELQHLIEFSQTVIKGKSEKDVWINEGLSTGAEYIYGNGTGSPAQQTSRINYFNSDPEDTIVYGNNFFVWDGWWEMPSHGGDVLADYATAYLFFQWLRIHADNDTGIYKEIIASPYADYRAVTYPANLRTSIISSSTDWDNLLSSWMIANARKDSSGVYGYKGQITPMITYFNLATPVTTYEFAPGEGIYSLFAGGHTSLSASSVPSGQPHIKYAGIPSTGTTIGRTAPYTGELLLTYNANTDTGGGYELGVILNHQNSGSTTNGLMNLRNMAIAPTEPLPTSYPIDVHFKPDGTVSDSPHAGTSVPTKKGTSVKKLVPLDKE